MAPTIDCLVPTDPPQDHHSSKRRKLNSVADIKHHHGPDPCSEHLRSEAEGEDDSAVASGPEESRTRAELDEAMPHPLGVKPLGNALDATVNIKSSAGLFACLPDEMLIQVFELANASDLLRVGSTCRALYAFCRFDDLWKSLFVDTSSLQPTSWRGTWRATFFNQSTPVSEIPCHGLYSDVLHRPWQCARLHFAPYASDIPAENAISRFSTLSPVEFQSKAKEPFVLTDPVKSWQIYRDWTLPHLLSQYKNTIFRAEAVDWPFETYIEYLKNNADESPLYLFDYEFAEKMDLKLDTVSNSASPAYTPPKTFEPDLFDVLGEYRPNRRWLIIGPKGSGSTFHADPNGTSAWNAVIRGSKYWLMFPPPADGQAPEIPGVHVSEDLSEVTAPLSLSEYLLTFHEYARRTPGCVEAVCHEGEVLYVPAGWYHMVVNLDDGIAVTQNFVSEAGLPSVLRFMRDRPGQVTGFKKNKDSDHEGGDGTEFELFTSRLRETYPNILESALEELKQQDDRKSKKTKWKEVTEGGQVDDAGQGAGGFSFAFDLEDEEAD